MVNTSKAATIAALLGATALACGAGPSTTDGQAGTANAGEPITGFSVVRDDATRVAGVHHVGAYDVRFEAMTTNESSFAATSVVRVGDAAFEWTRDPADGSFGFDGHDLVVTDAHKAAFVEMDRALMAEYMSDSGQRKPMTAHVALLLGQVHWLADARVGMTIPRMTLYHGTGAAAPGAQTPYNWGSDVNGPWWNVGPACAFHSPGSWNEAWICPYGQWGGGCPNKETRWAIVNGTGGASSSCHGSGCRSITGTHTGNWDCQGQCGEGCQNLGHNGVYQDCFEHDVCTDWYPDSACDNDKFFAVPATADSINGWCGGWRSGGR